MGPPASLSVSVTASPIPENRSINQQSIPGYRSINQHVDFS